MTIAKATSRAMSSVARVDHFWSKVEKHKGGCWVWHGTELVSRGRTNYGFFYNGQKNCLAHRFSYSLSCGPLSQSDQLHHLCKNTLCVNPAHLIVTTLADHKRTFHSAFPGSAKVVRTYRLPANIINIIRRMADLEQVSQGDIIEQAVRLLSAKKRSEGTK